MSAPNMQESRIIELYKSMRCMDCPDPETSIESVESAAAREMRGHVRNLIRKKCTDMEIYDQIGDAYGRHSIRYLNNTDASKAEINYDLKSNLLKMGLAVPIGLATFLLLKRSRKPTKTSRIARMLKWTPFGRSDKGKKFW